MSPWHVSDMSGRHRLAGGQGSKWLSVANTEAIDLGGGGRRARLGRDWQGGPCREAQATTIAATGSLDQ
jgi:hypothetical protein